MGFRNDLEAARARQEQLERELAEERERREKLEAGIQAARKKPDGGASGGRKWRRPVLFFASIVVFTIGLLVLVKVLNRGADLVWAGTLRTPGESGLPVGTACVLRIRLHVRFGEGLVGPWEVAAQCGGRMLLERSRACCWVDHATACRLHQSSRPGGAVYRAECTDRGLSIASEQGRLTIGSIEVALGPESAPLPEEPLLERDGWVADYDALAP